MIDDDQVDDDVNVAYRSVQRILSCAPSELVNSEKPEDRMTPLHLACHHGFREIAHLLIEQVQHYTYTHCLFGTFLSIDRISSLLTE